MIELEDLIHATAGRLHGTPHALRFTDIAFDSRRIGEEDKGQLFVAVKSDTGDGHDYILEAVQKGATGVLCQHVPPGLPPDVTCLVVQDTQQALMDWAGLVLRKSDIRVVGVTGSSGKTITKEAIATVLSTRFPVFKNPGSYSGRYGLPIALGRLEPRHRLAVLELAADSLNEVYDMAQLIRPSVGVVTAVNQAHMDTLGSLQAIQCEKGKLAEVLPPDGLAVLNQDDWRVWAMRDRTRARVVSIAIGDPSRSDADYLAHSVQFSPNGTTFRLLDRSSSSYTEAPFSLRLMGRHHIYAALAATAVGRNYNIPLEDIISALAALDPLPGRLRLIAGRNGSLLVDDSYDAELACTLAALDALADHFPNMNRIAVLGGIRTRNVDGAAADQVGARAAARVDELVLKGERTHAIRQAATRAGMDGRHIFQTYTADEAARHLSHRVQTGDVVLVKGPREERMEEITSRLMRFPEQGSGVLVRQQAAFRHAHPALPERPTWLTVDLDAVAHNLHLVQNLVGEDVGVMVVLKADGYGHGATRVARTAVNNGACMLGVACLSEAVVLRRVDILAPILVLGYTPAWQAREAVLNDVTATVFDLDTARAFSRAAGEVGRTARLHVKVDTGMGRLGLLPDQVLPFLHQLFELPHLIVEGIFTHFSVADEKDKGYTYWQLGRFQRVLEQARSIGLKIPVVHAANSAAILTVPEARFNMVRLGIALYGLAPSKATALPPGFRPALTFETRIAQVKRLPPDSFVSYGNTYQTTGEQTIAVIPVGYADGFRRAPTHWGYVLVRGKRAPIVGRVCMDQTMIDVTHIPSVRQGDSVVLIGSQGNETITVDQVAARLGTVNYEVVSEILARVPRIS